MTDSYYMQFYSWVLLFSGLVALVIAILLVKFKTISAKVLKWLEFSIAAWCAGMTMESAATTVPLKLFWSQIAYLGTTAAPLLYLLFTIAYSQYEKTLNKKNISILTIIPFITLVLAFTNSWHHWIWTAINIDPYTNIALYSHGPWFWVFILYSYLCIVAGMLFVIVSFRKFPEYYKEQTFTLLIAAFFPLAGNIIYISNINPFPGLEWTPIAFMITGAALAFSIFKLHMFELVPIARNNIVDSMNDGIIVFDNKDRILDFNPAMREILHLKSGELIGRSWVELNEPWKNNITALSEKPDDHYDIVIPLHDKIIYYNVQLVTLYNQKKVKMGKLYLFHDISQRKNLELEREKLIKELQDALAQVKTLSGLLPICANCKKIRDDNGTWQQVESYVTKHSKAVFSHGICPECRAKLYPEYTDKK